MKISNSYVKLGMLAMLVFAFANTVYAQQGMGTNNPDKSSALDITSTTKGLLMPRMTTQQRTTITSPATGLQVYDITTKTHWYYNGSVWVNNLIPDLRKVGTNHITKDAGFGGNGTSVGSGVSNIAMGEFTLANNTTGSVNVAIGINSMAGNLTGNRNVSIGSGALTASKGSFNVGVGINAGKTLTAGDHNIFIGEEVQPNVSITGSNQLNIGNWIYGNSGRIGIGASNPAASAALEIFSTNKGLLMPRMSTGQRGAITSPATGLEVYDTTTNTHWFYNGAAWVNINGQVNDLRMIGNNHITQDAGVDGNGTSVGTGFGNVAIGAITLAKNTTGATNVAIGLGSLSNNTIGASNMAIGILSLKENVIGNNNVGIGGLTLKNSTGNGNTAFGRAAGSTLTAGNDNIFIGDGIEPNVSITGSNQLNIGNWIYGDNGNIGIGVPKPTEKLEVNGTIKATDINFTNLPIFSDNTTAAGLSTGDMYRTTGGALRIKI